jgi:hypothetical protein
VVRVHLDRGDIREGWPPCFIDIGDCRSVRAVSAPACLSTFRP